MQRITTKKVHGLPLDVKATISIYEEYGIFTYEVQYHCVDPKHYLFEQESASVNLDHGYWFETFEDALQAGLESVGNYLCTCHKPHFGTYVC